MYNTASETFQNVNYKFKHQSEHTVMGLHMDLELQMFFKAKDTNATSTTNHAAIAVLFSV